MEYKYECSFLNATDKIKFISTAYNFGFLRGEQKIRNWQKEKAFPYGRRFNFEQDAYSDISFLIYQCIKKTTCYTED